MENYLSANLLLTQMCPMEYNYQVESAPSNGNVFFSSVVDFGVVHLDVQHVTGNPLLRLTRSVAQNTERRWGCSRKAFQCQEGSSMYVEGSLGSLI